MSMLASQIFEFLNFPKRQKFKYFENGTLLFIQVKPSIQYKLSHVISQIAF